MILRTVTLEEANALLPLVREHFFRIHVLLARMQELRDRAGKNAKKQYVFDVNCETLTVINKKRRSKSQKNLRKKVRHIERMLETELNELMRMGAVIKSLVPAHIDFLATKNDQLIYLCWHGGEAEISHWHYLDDGAPFRHFIVRSKEINPHLVH